MIETVTVVPQDVPTWSMLLNPIWWLMDGGSRSTWTAPVINNGALYLPNITNQFLRNLLWWIRNPCANFVGFIIGFEGVTYKVIGTAPVLATTWRDVDPNIHGWKWSLINYCAPFVSYWGGWFEFYLGWRPASGGLGLKIVFHSV